MKPTLKFLFLFLVLVALTGCASQKRAGKAELASVLHAQALKALEDGNFKIVITEFYPDRAGKNPIKNTDGSYVSLQNGRAVIQFSPALFPAARLDQLKIESETVEFTRQKSKKNGDVQFMLRTKGEKRWYNRIFQITLYKNTNECFVLIDSDDRSSGTYLGSFRGNVYPQQE